MTESNTTELAAVKAAAIAIAPLSIKDTVLAQFKEAETSLTTLADRYRDVAYDTTTPKGMRDAIAARADLRDNGRLFVTRAEKRIKADVNDLKRVMAEEVERLVGIVQPVEESIDKQIKAEEERKAAEKAERGRIEAERVGAHLANIDKLKSYVTRAEGQPVDAIERAIQSLQALQIGAEWEEFADEALAARANTIESLQKQVANERQRLENERLAKELADAHAALAAERAANAAAERIRAEEAAKLQREADAKTRAEAEAEAERINQLAAEAAANDAQQLPVTDQPPLEQREEPAKPAETVSVQAPAAIKTAAEKAPIEQRVEAGQTMTLGAINGLMGIFDVKATTLAALGITTEKHRGAVRMDACDFDVMCLALLEHIEGVRAHVAKQAA